ncbi:MAG: hypothetical protein JHC84_02650 [Solirubrobacteraceae bacterium]|nr:hypothetical protein [Solirubrobacteraceae bacterium]
MPVDGVVTSWQTSTSASNAASLVRVRAGEVAESARRTDGHSGVGAGSEVIPVSLRVRAGDRLTVGFSGTFTGTTASPAGAPALVWRTADGGEEVQADARVAMVAVIEPDADGDGKGDETQDECPSGGTGPCPTFSVVADDVGPLMPGDGVTRTFRVTNTGPGLIPESGWVAVRGPQGATATADGRACPRRGSGGSLLILCDVGRVGVGRTMTVVVSASGLRAPAAMALSVGYRAPMTTLWPGPVAQSYPLAVPTLASLRPTVRVARRLERGRLSTRISCPVAGTQDCRVGVLARLATGTPLARTTRRIQRGKTVSVRLRMPASLRAKLRRKAPRVGVTVTRTDLRDVNLRVASFARVTR